MMSLNKVVPVDVRELEAGDVVLPRDLNRLYGIFRVIGQRPDGGLLYLRPDPKEAIILTEPFKEITLEDIDDGYETRAVGYGITADIGLKVYMSFEPAFYCRFLSRYHPDFALVLEDAQIMPSGAKAKS